MKQRETKRIGDLEPGDMFQMPNVLAPDSAPHLYLKLSEQKVVNLTTYCLCRGGLGIDQNAMVETLPHPIHSYLAVGGIDEE